MLLTVLRANLNGQYHVTKVTCSEYFFINITYISYRIVRCIHNNNINKRY